MERWFVEQYVHSEVVIPERFLQVFLNQWVKWTHILESLPKLHKKASPESLEITEMSEELMAVHYNKPASLFQNFLGSTMKYSMGFWQNGAQDLDEAQEAMMADLCQKAAIKDGAKILDIGCGFGSLAGYILQRYPESQVYGLNLSKVHCQYIREKQNQLGHALNTNRFHLLEGNFSDYMTEMKFDYIVSIGFFEHVANLKGALERISQLLAPDGMCFLHYIVCKEATEAITPASNGDNFIQNYIFPGSYIHSYNRLLEFQDRLQVINHWYLNGYNYQRTLESWLQNFKYNLPEIRQETSLSENDLRMWELYFRACIAVFKLDGGNSFGNGQYLIARCN